MKLKIQDNNYNNSRVTFSSKGETRLKIAQKDKPYLNQIKETLQMINENVKFVSTFRTRVRVDKNKQVIVNGFT